ncbi:NADPH:quinone reductase [Sorangium sp. So ce1182]|uniref:NADPH:quinone reductase n=1 Tax=Sorangium sp. So ce1182 TaxID=3133334 RepID=UPI003F6216F1
MIAAWYEKQGPAREVLIIGELPDPEPGPGEVRLRVAASGINPGDLKKRQDAFGIGMPYPRVIPHSDGAGTIDSVGEHVSASRIGERVWCYGAQSYRPFGTAAEYVVVPSAQAVPLPDGVSFEQGACLGIPGITAHRAVHVAGPVAGRPVLVQGGGGAVGCCAVGLARQAGARVIATVRSEADVAVAARAGAHEVVRIDGLSTEAVVDQIRALAPDGVEHVVEVAFDANIGIDEALLKVGGSLATYATGNATPAIPFWQLLFKNIGVFFLGSDDFQPEAKAAAANAVNAMLRTGWPGFSVDRRFPLAEIADAHEHLEARRGPGRVIVMIPDRSRRIAE